MDAWGAGIRDERGATLVESMVAFVLLTMAAVTIYPVFIQAKKKNKFGDARQACENTVRSKLEEYRAGRPTAIADAVNGAGTYAGLPANTALQRLSMTDLSGTSIVGVSDARRSTENSGTLNGFFYTKLRYNRYFPYACMGRTQATIFQGRPSPAPRFGMRECIGNNVAWFEDPASPNANLCTDAVTHATDRQINAMIPGFKLYVKLELNTPWLLPYPGYAAGAEPSVTGNADKDAQFLNQCPNFGSWNGAAVDFGAYFSGYVAGQPDYNYRGGLVSSALYDFDGLGDAVKVTVTGVMDFPSVSAGIRDLGGVTAAIPERLTCSISGVIAPPVYPVRYYLTRTGRILSIHSHGGNGSEDQTDDGGWVFKTLYTQTGAPIETSRHSGIVSFAVHPRNLSVYALKRGSLLRYGNCGGVPVDCRVADRGVSDQGVADWPPLQEFQIPPAITAIGVNFRNGDIFGLYGDRYEMVRIVQRAGRQSLANFSGNTLSENDIELVPVADTGEFPKLTPLPTAGGAPGPARPVRMTGFFISPDGSDAFVSDLTSTGVFQDGGSDLAGSASYSSAIYRIQDTQLLNPVARLPFDSLSFSK